MDRDEALRVLSEHSTGDELDQIGAHLRSEGAATHVTLPWLLFAWSHTTANLVDAAWSVDEYTNDLCGRDLLEKAIELASPNLKERLTSLVAALDQEFLSGTTEDTEGRLAIYFKIGTDWWWRRIPPESGW